MEISKAEKVVKLMSKLNIIKEIQETTIQEKSHWWGLITPSTKKRGDGYLQMPDVLREEFVEAVKRARSKIEDEIAGI